MENQVTKKNAKKKTKAPAAEQLKIAGTGRTDGVDAIDKAAQTFQAKVAAVNQAEVARDDANEALTESLVENNRTEYIYEGKDGIMYCAYVPNSKAPKAKVRKVKRAKPDLGDGEQD